MRGALLRQGLDRVDPYRHWGWRTAGRERVRGSAIAIFGDHELAEFRQLLLRRLAVTLQEQLANGERRWFTPLTPPLGIVTSAVMVCDRFLTLMKTFSVIPIMPS